MASKGRNPMAKKTTKLSVHLTDKEQIWGIIYLLFSLFVLPYLLSVFNSFLPVKLNDAWFNFLYFTLNFLFIFWIFHGFFKRSLMFAGTHIGDFLLAVLLGAAAYWLCNWGLSMLFSRVFPQFENLNDSAITAMVHSNFFIMLLGTVIFVPVAEEALHRGLVFGSLYPKSHTAAYILSTVIFAAVHTMNYVGKYDIPSLLLAFLQYVPAGLILAWAYRKSGSIFASILIHSMVNAISLFSISITFG